MLLGYALFIAIGGMAMWVLVFLLGFIVPYWVTIGSLEMLRPKRLTEEEAGEETAH